MAARLAGLGDRINRKLFEDGLELVRYPYLKGQQRSHEKEASAVRYGGLPSCFLREIDTNEFKLKQTQKIITKTFPRPHSRQRR